MNHWRIAYKRVSTVDQNTDRQLDGMTFDRVYEDKCSGSTTDRPALQQMIQDVRDNDEIFVHDISRAARNVGDLNELVKTINSKNATITFVKENLRFTGDKSNPTEELLLNLLASVYQFERSIILERQREGIAKAKQRGVYKGRRATVDAEEIIRHLKDGVSMRKVAALTHTSLSTVTRVKSKHLTA